MHSFSIDFETLSLTEIIRLQNQLSEILTHRFEQQLAVVFSDIVGSTAYFSRFGDEAGHRLQQRHLDLLSDVIKGTSGQILNTAGDEALLIFPKVELAIQALLDVKKQLIQHNSHFSAEQKWMTRACVHWGPTLLDGMVIAGDSVNICSKVASTANPGEIRLTQVAFNELPNSLRSACQMLGPISIPGTCQSLEVMELLWRELFMIPTTIRIEETGSQIPLPEQSVVTIGRYAGIEGNRSNDIVLQLPDPHLTKQISRWHIEIRQESEGLMLYVLSDKLTEVNGKCIHEGNPTPITIGSQVRLAGVITLQFHSQRSLQGPDDLTLIPSTSPTDPAKQDP